MSGLVRECVLFYDRRSSMSDCELVLRGKDRCPAFVPLGHCDFAAAGPVWGGLSLQVLLLGSDATQRGVVNVLSFLFFSNMFRSHHVIFWLASYLTMPFLFNFACFSGVPVTASFFRPHHVPSSGVLVMSSHPIPTAGQFFTNANGAIINVPLHPSFVHLSLA